jgi:putative protein kinase ArgK-like GTPase of G3E family
MNKEIIIYWVGTSMGTSIKNLDKYKKLWDIFEEKLKTLNLSLSSFSKEWEKNNETIEENDYNKVYDRLKKQKNRKNKMERVQESSITQMEIYIKFLDKDFTAEIIRDDETYEHWFD